MIVAADGGKSWEVNWINLYTRVEDVPGKTPQGTTDVGWHTFRHTYRSWLDEPGASRGVQQKLMRHGQISTTINVYGNALMDAKREANSRVVKKALRGVGA